MRSSIILSAAFAFGAIAGPMKREMVYEVYTDVEVVEVVETVYVTATGPPAISAAAVTSAHKSRVGVGHGAHRFRHTGRSSSAPSSAAAPAETSSSAAYVASVASTPAYTPPASSTPKPTPSSVSAAAYTPKPSSTPAPVSSVAHSSAAPVSSAAGYAGGVGPAHTTGEAQSDITEGEEYINMVLYHHNANRAVHGAGVLTWDEDLVVIAKNATQCGNWPFQHTSSGQNMAASGPIANVSAGITEGWVNGEEVNFAPYYGVDPVPDGVFESVGHFTQVVWKEATKVGCYTENCLAGKAGMFVTVCNYDTGNVGGGYANNVGKRVGSTQIHWTD